MISLQNASNRLFVARYSFAPLPDERVSGNTGILLFFDNSIIIMPNWKNRLPHEPYIGGSLVSNPMCGLSYNCTAGKAMSELICYCFDYTKADIEKDFQENGRSLIIERVQNEKKFGNCQCGVKNPKGR